jgi:phage tail-like protein
MARRDADPYSSFKFLLVIGNVQVGGFSECTGLQMEMKTFDYKEGGRNNTTLKFPEHVNHGNVTLKHGVTLAADQIVASSKDMLGWQLLSIPGRKELRAREGSNFEIYLKDERGNNVKQWNLVRAFPVKWTGPDLKASAGEIAIESLEIAHEGILVLK